MLDVEESDYIDSQTNSPLEGYGEEFGYESVGLLLEMEGFV